MEFDIPVPPNLCDIRVLLRPPERWFTQMLAEFLTGDPMSERTKLSISDEFKKRNINH